jgi:hypothetical protein
MNGGSATQPFPVGNPWQAPAGITPGADNMLGSGSITG